MPDLAVLDGLTDVHPPRTERPDSLSPSSIVEEIGSNRAVAWDRFVNDHPKSTFFHTWGWRKSVCGVFPHEPIYLAASRDGELRGILPLMFVRSQLFGRMLVSVPYGVGGGILASDPSSAHQLFQAACVHAERLCCRCIDFRSEHAALPDVPVSDRYVGFKRQLPDRAGDVSAWIPRKARAAARNARQKFHVEVRYDTNQLSTVWKMYAGSMRRLGSIAYSRAFFEHLLEHHPNRCLVSVAERQSRPVAGLVTFLYRDTVMPYFIGATEEAKGCSAANLLYLDLMERAVREGYRYFDFGRTRRDNLGSFDFKRFHGFEPRPLAYQCHTLPGHRAPNLSPKQTRFELARRVWRRLPLRLTTALGGRLAAHIPG